MLRATNDNLKSDFVTEPVTRRLISAARNGGTFTYGEMMGWLVEECGLEETSANQFARAVGVVLGAVQKKIDDVKDSAPFLNVLVVRKNGKNKGRPGPGARVFLAERYPDEPWLSQNDAYEKYREDWVRIVEQETEAVCAYPYWERVYQDIYGKTYEPDPFYAEGVESDGLPRGRGGEGINHKALRLWVKDNPEGIDRSFRSVRAETEVDLLSGDRVDVVFYADREIVAIEVKSRDSNWADLRRGIYQCVKYEAVLCAQELRNRSVRSLLVTETELYGDLKELAKKLGVKHKVIPLK